ncbi:MAG: hypothetical protein MPJ02_08985 [Nitrosopumilus sp.]|nr:hypothetical protein [Nitrosopumilus sp.]
MTDGTKRIDPEKAGQIRMPDKVASVTSVIHAAVMMLAGAAAADLVPNPDGVALNSAIYAAGMAAGMFQMFTYAEARWRAYGSPRFWLAYAAITMSVITTFCLSSYDAGIIQIPDWMIPLHVCLAALVMILTMDTNRGRRYAAACIVLVIAAALAMAAELAPQTPGDWAGAAMMASSAVLFFRHLLDAGGREREEQYQPYIRGPPRPDPRPGPCGYHQCPEACATDQYNLATGA